MKKYRNSPILLLAGMLTVICLKAQTLNTKPGKGEKYVMVIHGGSGTILRKNMTPARENQYKEVLGKALKAGYEAINGGGSSLDAVEKAINIMEDSPLFNAGKGAVFAHNGRNEMDASIMNGATLAAGAVAGVSTIKNPISGARAVMEKSAHVMMSGEGADQFARKVGLAVEPPEYFYTEARWKSFQKVLRTDSLKTELDHDGENNNKQTTDLKDSKFGTVGAVARDKNGNLAAGTSTGGMTNKMFGRIGDSPVIGAGTYANGQVAVSCTGWGEHFIRNVVAFRVAALMEYKKYPLKKAGVTALEYVKKTGGDGGLIAIDNKGNIATPFTTNGMFRASITESGMIKIEMYKD